MVQKRAQLSDGCKAVFKYLPPAAATPVSYAPAAKPSMPLNLTPHKLGRPNSIVTSKRHARTPGVALDRLRSPSRSAAFIPHSA
jgi:hypothetical protein